MLVRRVGSTLALLAIALWLGGLVALGAFAAPAVFSIVAYPANADAMTVVFRRFNTASMVCAAIVLATEATRAVGLGGLARLDAARAFASALAAAVAVFVAVRVSPRIAALHSAGAMRGLGPGGAELARLHDAAEACGQAEIVLLTAVVILHVLTLSLADRLPLRRAP